MSGVLYAAPGTTDQDGQPALVDVFLSAVRERAALREEVEQLHAEVEQLRTKLAETERLCVHLADASRYCSGACRGGRLSAADVATVDAMRKMEP